MPGPVVGASPVSGTCGRASNSSSGQGLLEYLYASVDVQRARRNVERLHDLYGGRCQLCLFDPQDRYGHRLCHGHHVEWLSRGGADELENMVLLCPNHHAAVHRDDAPFDYGDAAFRFSVGRTESLLLNVHLTAG